MTARQWHDLLAYYRVEPFGFEVDNLRPAIIATTVAQTHAPKGHVFSPADFTPRFGPKPKASPAELQARILAALRVKGH